MSYSALDTIWLRESAATTPADTDGQDAAVTLPETVRDLFVLVRKTAEANADNLLTVRLHGYVNGAFWRDLKAEWTQKTQGLTTAADAATGYNAPNVCQSETDATLEYLAYYKSLPTNTIRSVWIASGTAVSHTFSVLGIYTTGRM